jgi:hypothetical protein
MWDEETDARARSETSSAQAQPGPAHLVGRASLRQPAIACAALRHFALPCLKLISRRWHADIRCVDPVSTLPGYETAKERASAGPTEKSSKRELPVRELNPGLTRDRGVY